MVDVKELQAIPLCNTFCCPSRTCYRRVLLFVNNCVHAASELVCMQYARGGNLAWQWVQEELVCIAKENDCKM